MKNIKLTKGYDAIVDDEDYEELSGYKWQVSINTKERVYATRRIFKKGKGVTLGMHRHIMKPPKGMVVDHIDRNTLNNTRNNLRICTYGENGSNRIKAVKQKTSIYKGVSKMKNGQWWANIYHKKVRYDLGRYTTESNAAIAYNNKAKELHGEFAKLNVIKSLNQ